MNKIHPKNLKQYLEQKGYKVLDAIDVDWLIGQPRHTLYQRLKTVYKSAYEADERIVLYSANSFKKDMLQHIHHCAEKLDISNFFILLCSNSISTADISSVTGPNSFSIELVNIGNPLIPLPEHFCYIPWAHMEILSSGEVKPCCVYTGVITKSSGEAFNINKHTDTFEDVYHSEYLSTLREQFRQGHKPNGCRHCWVAEENGNGSHRLWSEQFLGDRVFDINLEEESVNNLMSFDIKLGNLCNLKCRICNPKSSSKVAAEQIRVLQSQGLPTDEIRNLNKQGNWTENDEIWQGLRALGPQIVNLEFTGGEPLLIPQHETFLDFLIEQGYANQIRLHYNSNATVYPEQLLYKWQQFRHVDIAFSIDNTGARFELERDNSNWESVNQNLDNFLDNRLDNMSLSVYPTVNIQNVLYLPELLDWYQTKQFDALHFSWLEHPEYLDINNIGSALAELIAEKLINSKHSSQLSGIIEMLKNTHSNKLQLFLDYMENLDKIRKQSFYDTHKELAELIKKVK